MPFSQGSGVVMKKGARKAVGVRDVDDYNERVFSSH